MTILLPPLLAWIAIFAIIGPANQEFPLDDDGIFNASYLKWLNGGGIDYYQWTSTPQLGQWVWALPFTWVLGHTFLATRVSTIVLALLAAVAFYRLLRKELGIDERGAVIGSLLLSMNPLFMMCAVTFMTDVPALAFALVALMAFGEAGDRRRGWMALGIVAAVAAMATRQNAIVVPMALAWASLKPAPGIPRRAGLAVAALLLIIGLGIDLWFRVEPTAYAVWPTMPTFDHVVMIAASVSIYGGLFIAPLVVIQVWQRPLARSVLLGTVLAVGWLLYVRVIQHQPFTSAMFPYLGNLISSQGTFGEQHMLGVRPVLFEPWLRLLLTLIAFIGAASVGVNVVTALRDRRWPGMVLATGILHLPFVLISWLLFDRYLLVFVPPVIAGCLWRLEMSERSWRSAMALVLVMGLPSTLLVHDWLSWNVARWDLGRAALTQGYNASDIEGGFEWDQMHAIREQRWKPDDSRQPVGLTMPFHATLVEGLSGRCGLTFSPLAGTTIVARTTYFAALGMDTREMLLVCRDQ